MKATNDLSCRRIKEGIDWSALCLFTVNLEAVLGFDKSHPVCGELLVSFVATAW
ncbi:hypothetical protein DM01DRAFT_1336765 [Hesseltinella vesiculosa]|uniref:Uncharacterized protein n=1 Tax=Hesseltinella vesiculosa TaxID=101127 RepID=A0A1X2GF67_9FUNG|nr:hypothetical protein DM01DRAFT_1336765 [Hesseltinella vesiculosa]